jgi:hypothetical protein
VQPQTNLETPEIVFTFAQKFLRLDQGDFVETNEIARPKLRSNRQVNRDHVGDLRITADRLAIPEEENWLTIWWNLQGPGRDGF